MDIRARLGKNVRQLREARGWSQEDYADRTGIHRTYVSDIERGRRKLKRLLAESVLDNAILKDLLGKV